MIFTDRKGGMHLIVLYIILALILLIGAILTLPIKITLEYKDDLLLSATILGSRQWSYPKQKKKVKLSRYSNKAIEKRKRRAQKKRLRLEEKRKKQLQKNKTGGPVIPPKPKEKTGLIEDLELILKQISVILTRGIKHARIEVQRFIIRVAAEDAAQTAILFGAVNQAAIALLEFLDQVGKLKQTRRSKLSVTADFASQKSTADIRIVLTLRLWQVADILWRTSLQYEEILFGPTPNYEYNSSTSSKSNQ